MLRILDAFPCRSNQRVQNSVSWRFAALALSERTDSVPARAGRRVRCYTFCVRQLIVNADDFGLTAGVNRAIVETHSGGVVSSATLMANGAAFDDAVRRARSAPNLSVGCHVVLVDGTPVSPPDAVDTLLAIRSAEPDKFYSSLSAFAARAMLGGFDRDQLVAEVTAQIRKIQAAGLAGDSPRHAQARAHLSRDSGGAAARGADLRRARDPQSVRSGESDAGAAIQRQARSLEALWPGAHAAHFLRAIPPADQARRTAYARRRVGSDRDRDRCRRQSGYSSLLRQTLASLPEGTWELVCHPGYNDADLRAAGTRLLDSRDEERRLLTSPELRQFLEEQKIRVIGYREFCRESAETFAENRPE